MKKGLQWFKWDKAFTQTVLRLAVPIMIQSLMVSLMHIVDNVMIGQLGEYELAGVTQANRISFLLQVTMFGVVSGSSVLTAQFWGKKDVKGIRSFLGLGLITALCVAALYAVPSLVMPEKILAILIQDERAAASGVSYLRVVAIAYFVQAISLVNAAVLKSTEQVKLPMRASILAILVNTCLNYLLIFGKFGFPKLGVKGAAIATVIGCGAELLVLIVTAYKNNMATAARLRELRPACRADIGKFFRIVLPTMLNEGFWSLGMVMYSIAYGRMGASTVAAVSIFNNIDQLASVMLRGTTHACAVMVGMAVGQKRYDDAHTTAKRLLFGSMAACLGIGVVVALLSPLMVSLFNVSAETAGKARALIRVYAGFIWAQAAATTLIVGILRAGGDVKYAMVTDVAPVWLIGVPLVFWLGPGLGLPIYAVFAVTRIEEIVKSVISYARLNSGKWIHNLVEKPEVSEAVQD